LNDQDFIKIPVWFKSDSGAVAYLPNMINMLVCNEKFLAAKPYGPTNSGNDVFEQKVENQLGATKVKFIEDY